MEEIIPKLVEAGGSFGLLVFIVWSVVGMFRSLVEHNAAMAERLVATNAELASALKSVDESRRESQQIHQEQTLLIKMTLDKVSEHLNG